MLLPLICQSTGRWALISNTKGRFYEIVAPEQIEKVVKQAELLIKECREYQSDPENQNYNALDSYRRSNIALPNYYLRNMVIIRMDSDKVHATQ